MEKMQKAESLLDEGDFAGALAVLKRVRSAACSARWFLLKGEALRGLGLFSEALAAYEKARKLAGLDEGLLLEIELCSARCERALGNEVSALSAAKRALALAKRLGRDREEAELEWALALRLTGKLSQAATLFTRLLKGYRKAGDHTATAFVLWAIGGLYRVQGRYQDGIKAFEGSMEAAKRASDESAQGYALFGLGGILRVAGFMGRALDCYVRARRLFSSTDDTFAKAYAECGTANVLRQLGRLEEAYAGYERAHRLYTGISDWADLGFVEWGMGEIKKRNGDFPAAFKNYKAAAALFRGRSEPRGEALTMLSLSNLCYLRGRTAEAERRHAAALRFIHRHGLHTHLETFT